MLRNLLISLINIYQTWFSFDHGILSVFAPGGACKYPISCSEYTKNMILSSGVFKGIWLGAKRIWGCR